VALLIHLPTTQSGEVVINDGSNNGSDLSAACAEIIKHKPCIGVPLKNNSPANINKYNCIADNYLVPLVYIVFVIF
jgi:hypothetical protein